MNNIYYLIWSDAILRFRKYNPERKDWKLALFIFLTWMHALNAWIIILWLKYFEIVTIPKLSINVFPGNLIDSFIVFTIEFALPFAILNYFLIFHKSRYKKITEKYGNVNTRSALVYSFTIIFAAFISAILYGILS